MCANSRKNLMREEDGEQHNAYRKAHTPHSLTPVTTPSNTLASVIDNAMPITLRAKRTGSCSKLHLARNIPTSTFLRSLWIRHARTCQPVQ